MISSRDNARVKRWAKLLRDARARREESTVVVEGPHLVAEVLQAGIEPLALLVSESWLGRADVQALLGKRAPVVLGDRVFKALADADTPQGIAAEIAIPRNAAKGDCVFLEGVQDPSNVGAILRSAAAFGAGEAVLDRNCADAWSAKALRAGMGGQFKLALRQVPDLAKALGGFEGSIQCAVLTGGIPLHEAQLDGRLGWIFGAEGRGVSERTARLAQARITIPMQRGTESLNVAAAAAICLYEAFRRTRQISTPGAGS
jgi:TrmH family RNA methyltransferase